MKLPNVDWRTAAVVCVAVAVALYLVQDTIKSLISGVLSLLTSETGLIVLGVAAAAYWLSQEWKKRTQFVLVDAHEVLRLLCRTQTFMDSRLDEDSIEWAMPRPRHVVENNRYVFNFQTRQDGEWILVRADHSVRGPIASVLERGYYPNELMVKICSSETSPETAIRILQDWKEKAGILEKIEEGV